MSQFKRLFIAEKPSLAKEIAEALGEMNGVRASRGQSFWTVGDDAVAWYFGHMYKQSDPKAYGPQWEQWSLESLPIVIAEDKWLLEIAYNPKKPEEKKERQQHVGRIIDAAKASASIVNCGDPGREGQLLIDESLIVNGIDAFAPNVHRLWTQSVARKDMIVGLQNLKTNGEKKNLYLAALCRSRADFQHGMTYSREFTLRARNAGTDAKISVGRVQTPTLRLVVDRDRERLLFKRIDHYLPQVTFEHANGSFKASWVIPQDCEGLDSEGYLTDKKVADAVGAKVSGKTGKVRAFKSDAKFQPPPMPFSLTTLQAKCGSRFGMTAQGVLDAAQSLYETHKATTYPRSECQFLPENILEDEAPRIMKALAGTDIVGAAARGADMSRKSAAWNTAKVVEHNGIIPTSEFSAAKLAQMTDVEKQVFQLIAEHFIAQFYPPYAYKALSAEVTCEGEQFRANGQQLVDLGWKKAFGEGAGEDDDAAVDDDAKQTIPTMAPNDPVLATAASVKAQNTKPPPAFTDGTLVTAMANIHKFVKDPEIKKRLKETAGIGTVATRGNMIETLLLRKFLDRKGKNGLVSTELGRSIIDTLPENLKDPGLTALWEAAMQQVESGTMAYAKFMDSQEQDMRSQLEARRGTAVTVKGVAKVRPVEGDGEECPACGQGKLVTHELHKGEHKGKRYLKCSRNPECKYTQWPGPKCEPLPGHGAKCPQCGKGKMLTKMVKTKDGRDARLLGCTNYPECTHSEWPERPKVPPMEGDGLPCTKCGTGLMKTWIVSKEGPNKGKSFLGCNNRECKHIIFPRDPVTPIAGHGKPCPACGTGKLETVEFTSKEGKKIVKLSCTNYNGTPQCRHGEWPEEKVEPLPGDGGTCTECKKGTMRTKGYLDKKDNSRKRRLSCDNYPACRNTAWEDNGPKKDSKGGKSR